MLHPLPCHPDHRGQIVELFQDQWRVGTRPVQWNIFNSTANVLRGVHVHLRHWDYLIVTAGSVLVALRDMRRDAPTDGLAVTFELDAGSLVALIIPPGVGHGFYSARPASMLQGVSHYFDTSDELGCHWADPDLGIAWPNIDPLLSDRDRYAQPLRDLRAQLPPFSAA